MTDPRIAKLAAAVVNGTGLDNALDVRIEVALFKPDEEFSSARANHAGTKVIYTRHNGTELTCWAPDWTKNRQQVAAYLKEQSSHA